jgi:hypothetical protein
MTRRHFEAIARTIRLNLEEVTRHGSPGQVCTVEKMARDLADDFESFNPNFDAELFLTACGVDV